MAVRWEKHRALGASGRAYDLLQEFTRLELLPAVLLLSLVTCSTYCRKEGG